MPSWLESEGSMSEDDLSRTLNLLYYFINFGGPYSTAKIIAPKEDEELPESNPILEFMPVYDDTENLTQLNRLKSDNDHLLAKEVFMLLNSY